MVLKTTIRASLLIYLAGLSYFYFRSDSESTFWFCIGGGIALINVAFAALSIRFGMKSVQSKAVFLGFLLLKSLTFVALVGMVLMFLKPLLLPFTLGIGLVIFGSIAAALWDIRKLWRKGEFDRSVAENEYTNSGN